MLLLSEVPLPLPADSVAPDRARDLDEALLLLGQNPYDAVIVDVSRGNHLPDLTAINRRAPAAALVALTPAGAPERCFEAWRHGAQECLSLPDFDAVALQRAARRALERKWLSGFLEERIGLLENAFQSLSPGIAVLSADGNLVLSNRSWRIFAEQTDDALSDLDVGANVLEALEGCGDAGARELSSGIRLVLSGQLPAIRVELDRALDGESRWFLIQVDPMPDQRGVVVTQTDITDRKRTEEALRRSEVDHRRLLEDLPQGVAVERDGVFVWVNRATLKMLGYDAAERLVGRKVSSVLLPGEAGLPSGAGTRDVRLVRADGGVALAEVRALRVVFDGAPATLIIGTDVGEHRALTARMMEVDRMSSAGLLAAALGHEIKNPLAFVTANVDIALRDAAEALAAHEQAPAAPEVMRAMVAALREIRGALQDARQGARRIESVVHDLRAFSRPEQRHDAAVPIERVLDAAVNMTKNELRHRARLTKDYSVVPAVRGSEAQLGQVFLNLLTNAADAIPVGNAAHNEIEIRLFSKEGRVIVEVRDTGAGIAPKDLPRVFDAFFTTKPVGQGTGLGLAICRNIVQAMGGSISVQSELGAGTTVRIELLPAAEEEIPASHTSTISPLKPLDDALRVLVVDDEPLIGRAVARSLGKRNAVRWVASGREALELLEAERFDVVFLDVMMPDLTGIDVYQQLSARAPEVLPRIVFVTGGAFTASARLFLEQVPNRQVGKPFEARQLREVAQEVAAHAGTGQIDCRRSG